MTETNISLTTVAHTFSLRREELALYFESVVSSLNNVGWEIDDEKLLVEDFAIEQMVIQKTDRKIDKDSPFSDRFISDFNPTSKFYEREAVSEQTELISWSNAISPNNLRLIIKGAPGSGKTFSTKASVIKTARESIRKLESFEESLEEIEIPIWLTAKQLARRMEDDVVDAIISEIKTRQKSINLSKHFYSWLDIEMQKVFHQTERLEATLSNTKSKFLIVIDALDELNHQDKSDKIKEFSKQLDKSNVRLIATCRTLQWDVQRELIDWRNLKSLELAPLKTSQKIDFIRKFFCKKVSMQSSAKDLLHNNHGVDYATDNSLILTFVCFLHLANKINVETTYIEIYKQMQMRLFQGYWKPKQGFPIKIENKVVKSYFKVTKLKKVNEYATLSRR